jgi:hypothetical protein
VADHPAMGLRHVDRWPGCGVVDHPDPAEVTLETITSPGRNLRIAEPLSTCHCELRRSEANLSHACGRDSY